MDQVSVPLTFNDSADPLLRVRRLAEFFAQHGDRDTFAIHNARQVGPDLSALLLRLEEVEGALKPFVVIINHHDALYRKRGGDPDQILDSHPAFNIKASELPIGVFRRARTALGKEGGDD